MSFGQNQIDTNAGVTTASGKVTVKSVSIMTKEDYDAIRRTDGVILAIPFGKPCREAVIEKINQLENQDCKIIGAILVDVNRKWMKLYGIQ